MIFQCGQYVPKTKSGPSGSVAVWWTEAQADTEWFVMKLGQWAFLGGIFLVTVGVFWTIGFRLPPVLPVIGILLFPASWGLMKWAWRISGDIREIQFEENGTLSAPDGLSTWGRRYRRMNAPHTEINTFEWEQLYQTKADEIAPYTHGVIVVLRDGSVCRIAQNLQPENARQLVVLLTKALAQVRIKKAKATGGPVVFSID